MGHHQELEFVVVVVNLQFHLKTHRPQQQQDLLLTVISGSFHLFCPSNPDVDGISIETEGVLVN